MHIGIKCRNTIHILSVMLLECDNNSITLFTRDFSSALIIMIDRDAAIPRLISISVSLTVEQVRRIGKRKGFPQKRIPCTIVFVPYSFFHLPFLFSLFFFLFFSVVFWLISNGACVQASIKTKMCTVRCKVFKFSRALVSILRAVEHFWW